MGTALDYLELFLILGSINFPGQLNTAEQAHMSMIYRLWCCSILQCSYRAVATEFVYNGCGLLVGAWHVGCSSVETYGLAS